MFDKTRTLIGLDVGNARIGIAVARPPSFIPVQVGVIPRKKAEHEIIELYKAEKTAILVVGLPLDQLHGETTQSEITRGFVRRLKARHSEIDIVFIDEFGSSEEAANRQTIAGGAIDSLSAVIILERYCEEFLK